MYLSKSKRVYASEEFEDVQTTPEDDMGGQVEVEDEVMDLLFETEDVAQLLAEATGEDVDVTVDDETGDVSFGVGDAEFTVSPEGDEEILEARKMPNKRSVKANNRRQTSLKRPVRANTQRVVRRGSKKR